MWTLTLVAAVVSFLLTQGANLGAQGDTELRNPKTNGQESIDGMTNENAFCECKKGDCTCCTDVVYPDMTLNNRVCLAVEMKKIFTIIVLDWGDENLISTAVLVKKQTELCSGIPGKSEAVAICVRLRNNEERTELLTDLLIYNNFTPVKSISLGSVAIAHPRNGPHLNQYLRKLAS